MTKENLQFSEIVLGSYRKVDWQKVIARTEQVEGPLPKETKGCHDLITNWIGVKVHVSRSFVEPFRNGVPKFSLKDESPLALAAGKAIHVVDVLWRVLTILHPKVLNCTGLERSIQATLIKYMCLALDGDIYKYLKYHTLSLFSKYEIDEYDEGLECPPPFGTDKAGTLLVGKLQTILVRLCSDNRRKWKMSRIARLTVLQGLKKGFPMMDEDDVVDSFVSGSRDLTMVKPVLQDLLCEIKRTVKEVLPNGVSMGFLDEVDRYATLSVHSCMEAGRTEGGALGAIRAKYCKSRTSCFHSWDSFLERLSYHPQLGVWEDRTPMWGPSEDGLAEFRRTAIERIFNAENPSILKGEQVVSQKKEKQERLTKMQLDEIAVGRSEPHRQVVFKGILEPLKVRPITVSSMAVNALWQPIQKQLWSAMQQFECFLPTGTPVTEQHISDLYHKSRILAGECGYNVSYGEFFDLFKFNSADYRSATNVLAMSASLAAAEAACPDPIGQMVMRAGLCGSSMSYYDKTDRMMKDLGVQSNGQLMGSVFSFPLLCMINAAIVRYTFEQVYGRSFRLCEVPFMVNGDDMLCMLPPWGYELWRGLTSAVGLEPSPGKNYYSRNFAMINSKIFDVDSSGDVEPRPFVNFSFITGVRKGGMGGRPEDDDADGSANDVFLKVVKTFTQSAEFHSLLPIPVQQRIELAIWDCQAPKWKALGLSTTSSGLDLRFNADLKTDNRVDYLLAKLRLGHYRTKEKVPAYRYDRSVDFSSTWRWHTALSPEKWEGDCLFIRRLIERKTHVGSRKAKELLREAEALSCGQRRIRVAAVKLGSALRSGREDLFRNFRARVKRLCPVVH